jgi:hypothetical protein
MQIFTKDIMRYKSMQNIFQSNQCDQFNLRLWSKATTAGKKLKQQINVYVDSKTI